MNTDFLAAAKQARNLLQEQPQQYKELWRNMDLLRNSDRERWWPDWCFLPSSILFGALGFGRDGVDRELVAQAQIAHLFGTWRTTQGVYPFDSHVYEHVLNTEQSGPVPVAVLLRLPEWCIYLPTPGATYRGAKQYGFFAMLDYDPNRRHPVLLLFVFTDFALEGMQIHLVPGATLDECIDQSFNFARDGITPPSPSDIAKMNGDRPDVMRMMNLLLFVCSQAGEVGDGIGVPRPAQTKTKKGARYFPPDQAAIWPVGARLGAKLRTALAGAGDCKLNAGSDGFGVRPHIRRAHWHGYWLGPKNSAQRAFDLRWMPPIAVKVDDVENLPATARAVTN